MLFHIACPLPVPPAEVGFIRLRPVNMWPNSGKPEFGCKRGRERCGTGCRNRASDGSIPTEPGLILEYRQDSAPVGNNQRRWISISRKKRSLCCGILDYPSHMSSIAIGGFADKQGYPDEQSRGQQGRCRPVVHRVLGQDLQSLRRR